MSEYFYHLHKFDQVKYTNYFVKEFIPRENFEDTLRKSGNRHVGYHNLENYTVIQQLSQELTDKYKFPKVAYMNIFYHTSDQPIHSDGISYPIYSSLNLPIVGFEKSTTLFYKSRESARITRDGNYYKPESVEIVGSLAGSNQWVLIDSSIPHNVVGATAHQPRITVCLRFYGNPKFQELREFVQGFEP